VLRFPNRRLRAGFSLIEVMLVVTLMTIMAGLIVVNTSPNVRDVLHGTADVLASEVAYARSLAVMNNSTYQLAFDTTTERITLTHIGTNAALNTLPWSNFRSALDTSTAHIVDVTALPRLGMRVQIHGVLAMSSVTQSVTTLAFGPLGETTRTDATAIWLKSGSGSSLRYLSITVNPVTGLTSVGEITDTAPAGL